MDPEVIHLAGRPGLALIGRILVAAIFLVSGIAKVVDPQGAIEHMNAVGIGHADSLVWVAGIAEIAGAIALISGFLTRIAAFGLALYLIPVTGFFHNFWAYSGAEQVAQMANFMKNVAIIGGLGVISALGPGRNSLDYLMRRPMEA
jgi:putative oxidoreductase